MKPRVKYGFAKFVNPNHSSSSAPKTALEWRVGAKFKRPNHHTNGGQVLTVAKFLLSPFGPNTVTAVEDGLWCYINDCTLVG